jgi:hypothetical protein
MCSQSEEHFIDINVCAKKCQNPLSDSFPEYCDQGMGCTSQLRSSLRSAEILRLTFPNALDPDFYRAFTEAPDDPLA